MPRSKFRQTTPSSSPQKKSKRDGASTSNNVPTIYGILFIVLSSSLLFNIYLFVNTKEHVLTSRQEQLVEEQLFHQQRQQQKEQREKHNRNSDGIESENSVGKPRLRKVQPGVNLGHVKHDSQQNNEDESQKDSILDTPSVRRINGRFARRVAVSYQLDAMAGFSHSYYVEVPTSASQTAAQWCLDRGSGNNFHVIGFPCHEKEIYNGAQSWKLSNKGELFTEQVRRDFLQFFASLSRYYSSMSPSSCCCSFKRLPCLLYSLILCVELGWLCCLR